jgi:hypothetical protein
MTRRGLHAGAGLAEVVAEVGSHRAAAGPGEVVVRRGLLPGPDRKPPASLTAVLRDLRASRDHSPALAEPALSRRQLATEDEVGAN